MAVAGYNVPGQRTADQTIDQSEVVEETVLCVGQTVSLPFLREADCHSSVLVWGRLLVCRFPSNTRHLFASRQRSRAFSAHLCSSLLLVKLRRFKAEEERPRGETEDEGDHEEQLKRNPILAQEHPMPSGESREEVAGD